MPTSKSLLATGLLLFAVVGLIAGGALAQSTTDSCQQVEDRQLCIEDFSLTPEYMLTGERVEDGISLTISNQGNTSASGAAILYVADPNNQTNAYQLSKISLDPGESETVTQPLNATTVGTHGLRIAVIDSETNQPYDLSAIQTVEVREEPPTRLGGPIDRTEIALGSLVLSLLGLLALGIREYRT